MTSSALVCILGWRMRSAAECRGLKRTISLSKVRRRFFANGGQLASCDVLSVLAIFRKRNNSVMAPANAIAALASQSQ